MNNLALTEDPESEGFEVGEAEPKWELKKLSDKHKEALALVAQGLKLVQVAALVDYTPTYVGMLLRQPLAKEYLREMSEITGARLDAMFEQSVEVIANTMKNGSNSEKLKAARLQLEATKRIGRGDTLTIQTQNPDERFARLADRLVGLLRSARRGDTYNEDGTPTADPEVLKYVGGESSRKDSPTQALEYQRPEESRPFENDSRQSEA